VGRIITKLVLKLIGKLFLHFTVLASALTQPFRVWPFLFIWIVTKNKIIAFMLVIISPAPPGPFLNFPQVARGQIIEVTIYRRGFINLFL